MINKRYIRGIAFVVLMLSAVSFAVEALTIEMIDPAGTSGTVVNDNVNASRTFRIQVNESANFTWYINGNPITSGVDVKINATRSNYTNNSAGPGNWSITVDAVVFNGTDTKSHKWWWNVTSAPAPEYFNTTPIFTTPPAAINITDTSADIRFTVNQSNAFTVVRYGTTALVNESWQNGTAFGNSRKIPLTGLTKGTTYNYSVYAYNGSNQSYSSNSPINSFTTTNPTTPNITNISTIPTASSVNISFSVNQNDAKTRVYYGLTEALELGGSGWKNNTISPITIMLSNLNSGTKYYYSVYAYSGSNQSYFSNSPNQNFTTITPTAPNITNITTRPPTDSSVDIIFSVNQSDAKTRVYFGLTEALELGGGGWKNSTISPITITLSNLSNATKYYYSIYAYNGSNQSYFSNSTINSFTTKYPAPKFLSTSPNTPWQTIGIELVNFTVTFDQIVNVSWLINGSTTGASNNSVTSAYYLNNTPSTGTWNITVVGSNANGTAAYKWLWTVRSKTYETGNRIWDSTKEMNLTYTWNPMSFYAFYYDVDNNVGNESLKIILDSNSDRNIQENTLVYSTKPDNVSFKYKKWGYYNVIGFMAEKYFAAYTAGSTGITGGAVISPIGSKQLHKILMDDDTQRVIYAGSTLTLNDGYVIKIKDVNIGAGSSSVWLSVLKDGNEIFDDVKNEGETFKYAKKVGSVSDLPIIALRIDKIFRGTEATAAFIKGIFQVSESFTSVNTGNRYNIMEITGASDTGITMANKNSLSLSPNSVNDVMGDIKIVVADNSSVLRFAPMVKKSGTYEVRGTISQSTDTTYDWNPLNFEGFYYDINEDVGSEKLSLTRSDRSVSENKLIYTTTPQSVSFKYKKFGSFNVIGFMAEKYFAGYTTNSTGITTTAISTINSKQLHKVLTDDDTQRTVYAGSTLTLNEGYVLKVKDVDITGGKIVLLSLLKDGNEIDTTAVQQGTTYVYTKRVGSVSDLPIIAARIETVFAGKEATAAFMKGIFQLSESYTSVKSGDQFGAMKISEVSDTKIEMKNPSSLSLSAANTIDVMGKIKFKVADSGDVRFYPFILLNGSVASANQLSIDAPATPTVKDTITITVTAGGTPVSGAAVSFDNNEIGTTNSTGKLSYTLTRSGLHNITATKLGYEKATKTIQVSEWVDNRLSIEVPAIIDQGAAVSIKVTSNGTAVAGASVTFDNSGIGTTDAGGILNYTFNVGGTHNIGASKDKYVSVVREINIRLPFSEYKALDISIVPHSVFTNEKVLIRSNITNTGTKADTRNMELILNGTVVDNKSIALAPGEIKEINFTRQEALPGNYTVEILGQKGLMEVREEPLDLLLIGGIATGLGAIIIYLFTAKSKISLEMLRQKLMGKSVAKGGEEIKK